MTKLCECGCGEAVPLAAYTSRGIGWVKGQPRARFVHGHNGRVDPLERLCRGIEVDSVTGCWNWVGATTSGYGEIHVDGSPELTHRLMWMSVFGPISDGLFVCHKCDNRPCCNPEHLFLGTTLDNMRDMSRKGRAARGTRNPRAVLTEDVVAAVKHHLADGMRGVDLAELLGLTQQVICNIKKGRIWKHVSLPAGAAL